MVFLDFEALRNLRDQADDRWYALSAGNALLPCNCPALLQVELSRWLSGLVPKRPVRLVTVTPSGDRQSRELTRNADGLFDVT